GGRLHRNAGITGIVGMVFLAVNDQYAAPGAVLLYFLPAHTGLVKLKGAVLYQLGIQAAVCRKIDILKENAPHGGLYGSAGLVDLHGELLRGLRIGGCKKGGSDGNEGQQCFITCHLGGILFGSPEIYNYSFYCTNDT